MPVSTNYRLQTNTHKTFWSNTPLHSNGTLCEGKSHEAYGASSVSKASTAGTTHGHAASWRWPLLYQWRRLPVNAESCCHNKTPKLLTWHLHTDTSCRALGNQDVVELSSPPWASRHGRLDLPREMFYPITKPDAHMLTLCLFSLKEEVPAAEQCLCDHSRSVVRIQPNGKILWNDYAQQIFYRCECRYGNTRNNTTNTVTNIN